MKLISKYLKVVFIYFTESIYILIIQQVFAKNVFLSQSHLIPVLDEVRVGHLLGKELLFLLDVLKVQDVFVREGADSTV